MSIIATYEVQFNMVFLDCLVNIFEAVDDDRMSKFVPYLVKWSI